MKPRPQAAAAPPPWHSLLLGLVAFALIFSEWSRVRALSRAKLACTVVAHDLADLAEAQKDLLNAFAAYRKPASLAQAFDRVFDSWQQAHLVSAKAQIHSLASNREMDKIEVVVDELASAWKKDARESLLALFEQVDENSARAATLGLAVERDVVRLRTKLEESYVAPLPAVLAPSAAAATAAAKSATSGATVEPKVQKKDDAYGGEDEEEDEEKGSVGKAVQSLSTMSTTKAPKPSATKKTKKKESAKSSGAKSKKIRGGSASASDDDYLAT